MIKVCARERAKQTNNEIILSISASNSDADVPTTGKCVCMCECMCECACECVSVREKGLMGNARDQLK